MLCCKQYRFKLYSRNKLLILVPLCLVCLGTSAYSVEKELTGSKKVFKIAFSEASNVTTMKKNVFCISNDVTGS